MHIMYCECQFIMQLYANQFRNSYSHFFLRKLRNDEKKVFLKLQIEFNNRHKRLFKVIKSYN